MTFSVKFDLTGFLLSSRHGLMYFTTCIRVVTILILTTQLDLWSLYEIILSNNIKTSECSSVYS